MKDPKKAFGKIYDRYIDKIYRFIFVKVSSQETAQDLCSEVFLRGWQAFQNQKSKIKNTKIENPQAFLYKIANNLVIDYYRKKAKTQIIPDYNIQMVDANIDLENEAVLQSDLDSVKQAISALKPDYQNVIIWHYLDELSIKEIAQILDRTEQATRVLLHRALTALRAKV